MDFGFITSYFTATPIDWIIFGACALFLSFDALRAGPARVTALALSLPISLYAAALVPQTSYLGSLVPQTSDALVVGIFLALTIALFVVFYRIADNGMDSLNVGSAILAGVAAAAVLMTVLLQLPDSTWPWSISAGFQAIFGSAYALYWTVAAYCILAFVRR